MIGKRKLLRAYFLDSLPFTGLIIVILTIAPIILFSEDLADVSNLYKFRAYFWQLYYLIGVPFCLGVFYAQIYRTVSTFIDMLKLRTVTEELNILYITKESFYCTGKRHYCEICPKNYAKFRWLNIALQLLRSYVVDEQLYSEQELKQMKDRISSGKRYTITSFRYSRIVISISPEGNEEQ